MSVPRLNTRGRFDAARLFHPGSVAVLGAETPLGAQILANIMMGGFTGQVRTDIAPNTHLAVLALPQQAIGQAMTDLAAAGCYAAIIPGACDDLAEHSARTGVRVLGPHAFGLAIPSLSLNATRAHIPPPPGRLAVIAQSAALTRAVIDWAEPNGVGFSYIVGIGANAGIGFSLTLDWLSRDSRTGAILLDIRRIKNHRQFLSAARAAARLRPVVAIRPGLRLATHPHQHLHSAPPHDDATADLSFAAALRRAGVLYVERLEDLLAAAETLVRAKPIHTDTLAIVSNALGPGRLAADSVVRQGLHLPPDGLTVVPSADLAPTAFARTGPAPTPSASPPSASTPSGSTPFGHTAPTETTDTAPQSPAAEPTDPPGGVLVVHTPNGADDDATINALSHPPTALATPLLICALGETVGAEHRRRLTAAGMPVFATPDEAVRGFGFLVQHRRNRAAARELPPHDVLAMAPDKARVRQILDTAHNRVLPPEQALAVLAAYGIAVAPTQIVHNQAEATAAAAALGYPVVLKQRTLLAPADRPPGGLIFDLHDPTSIAAAARLLTARAERHGEDGALLVQHQLKPMRELAVRVTDDATFGPVIGFGAGGTQALPMAQAIDLPPLNLALAHALITRLPTAAPLNHHLRDRPAANADAVAETLVRVSQLIVDFPRIAALHIPSLFAGPDGVIAADAWLRLRHPDDAPVPLAIAPYPANLITPVVLDEDRFTIRPIRPEDAEAHTAFCARLSPEDIRYRFFTAMRALSAEQTVRLTQVDYDREMVFIAVHEASGQTVGVARLSSEPGGESGEFAVIVQADMKGKGLASHLMRRLITWAAGQGIKRLVGQILADNSAMLAFIRGLGFTLHRLDDDPEVVEAVLELPIR